MAFKIHSTVFKGPHHFFFFNRFEKFYMALEVHHRYIIFLNRSWSRNYSTWMKQGNQLKWQSARFAFERHRGRYPDYPEKILAFSKQMIETMDPKFQPFKTSCFQSQLYSWIKVYLDNKKIDLIKITFFSASSI